MIECYTFSSVNLTNIWAGIGAERWAVSKNVTESFAKGRQTKAAKLRVGALGLLYCSDPAGQYLTTPFMVMSKPDPAAEVRDVWPEPWVLPFAIRPLGSPRKKLGKLEVEKLLPSLSNAHLSFGEVFRVQATLAFVPTKLTEEDWAHLIEHLAD